MPPREAPERFGKPRAELSQQSTRTALTIFGPLIAFGILLFWWIGRSRDKAAAAEAKGEAPTSERDGDGDGDGDDPASGARHAPPTDHVLIFTIGPPRITTSPPVDFS